MGLIRAVRLALAPTLSFLLPGLGQLVLGRPKRALLLALPLFVTAVAVAVALWPDPTEAVDLLLRPEALAVFLIVDGLLLFVHLAAILDAERLARTMRPIAGRARALSTGLVAALFVATVALHGGVGAVGAEAGDAFAAVFRPDASNGDFAIPEPSFEPGPSPTAVPSPPDAEPTPTPGGTTPTPGVTPTIAPTATPGATPSPSPTSAPMPAWAKDGRLNLLLIGSDAGPDRWSLRTDTIIVLSVDVKSGRTALFGIPRNLTGVPLPPESAAAAPDGRFPGLLNALYVYAMGHPEAFPGGDARGMRAVSGAVQELVGVRLDAMVVVNLAGFVDLVDQLGGLWIDIPEPLVDHMYPLEDGSGLIELRFAAGCQHLGGRMALAYARSRHQDSDYGRMGRQQTVLLALRRQVDPVALIPKVPALLRVAKDTLWTTIRRSDIRGLAQLAARVDPRRVARVLFAPSAFPEHLDTTAIRRIQARVRTIFDGPAPAADPDFASGHCP